MKDQGRLIVSEIYFRLSRNCSMDYYEQAVVYHQGTGNVPAGSYYTVINGQVNVFECISSFTVYAKFVKARRKRLEV